ncbi:MAG TPA: vitamin K epoxide reductase family protein [Kofleriaceae bacterium]
MIASRRPDALSWIALGLAVIGLGASLASLIDYAGASATFCADTGCDTVRASAWAHPLGVPMPVLGVGFFAAALGLGFAEAPRLRRALAIAGGAWALLLIGLQAFAIGAWCKLCLVADPAAIGYALAVVAGGRARALRPSLGRGLTVGLAVGATVGALALVTHAHGPAPVVATAPAMPGFVAAAQTPGAITLVEVVDFECPYCRRMQARLQAAIAQAGRPVHVVRKMLPLAMHSHARPAAIAYCCAEAQGQGDAMAAALFAAPPDELDDAGCERLAARIGCDLARYRDARPAAEARVAADSAQVEAAGIHALPTLFIGAQELVGAGKSVAELAAMIARG